MHKKLKEKKKWTFGFVKINKRPHPHNFIANTFQFFFKGSIPPENKFVLQICNMVNEVNTKGRKH